MKTFRVVVQDQTGISDAEAARAYHVPRAEQLLREAGFVERDGDWVPADEPPVDTGSF